MYTLNEVKTFAKDCILCPLSKTRTNIVFGKGNHNADIMFIGEAPGFYEDQSGDVFVGRAGTVLNQMLESINLKREDVYITNIVKCRPPDNRNPSDAEIQACRNFLKWQIRLIEPSIIVCLGAVAAKSLIRDNFKISKDRGVWYDCKDYSIIATYHPAALLRNNNRTPDVLKDFQEIKKQLSTL